MIQETIKALLATRFISQRYSRPFLKSLSLFPPTGYTKALQDACSKRMQVKGLETCLYCDMTIKRAVYLAVFSRNNSPVGYMGYIVTSKSKTRIGEIHGVYFDRTEATGVSDVLLDFLQYDLNPALGVQKRILKADYAGRYVWAMKGFQFDPKYRFYDIDGKRYTQWEIARRSLGRFLKSHHIPVDEVMLRGRSIHSLDELWTPADFAEVKHSRTIRVCPLINDGVLDQEAELNIGKAFMLGNYLPVDPPYVMSQGGLRFGQKFAVDAMPFWNGIKICEE